MTDFFTAADGTRIAYDDQGTGVAVLCLAGLTRNRDDFDPVVAGFAGRARIIRMDYRGRGASDWPGPETYQIPQEAMDALALLDHLGVEKVVLLGTSRGGLIGLTLAMMAPERLSAVIFNDVGPVIETEGLKYIMGYLGLPPPYADLDAAAAALPEVFAPAFTDVPAATWAAFARQMYEETPEGLRLRYDPRLREAVAPVFEADAAMPDLWPLFDALAGVEIGVIRGANSNLLSRETVAEMVRRRPDLIAAEVPKRGHVPFLDEPEAVAVIEGVLARVEAAS